MPPRAKKTATIIPVISVDPSSEVVTKTSAPVAPIATPVTAPVAETCCSAKKTRKSKSADPSTKAPRTPSAYNLFIKAHYHDEDMQKLTDAKQRFSAIAQMWKAHKASQTA